MRRRRFRGRAPRRWAEAAGQSTVELVGLVPLLVAVAFGVAQLLAAGIVHGLADHAAQAGAMALLQDGGSPSEAARDALPGWARDRAEVDVRGGRVLVTLRPPSPLEPVARALAAHATADAGATT